MHEWECLRQILKVPAKAGGSQVTASLPFAQGGLGLASTVRVRGRAHWASWADCLRMVRQRHPILAETVIEGLRTGVEPYFKPSEVVSTPSPRPSPVGCLWRRVRRSCLPRKPNPTNPRQGGSRKRRRKFMRSSTK